MENHYYEIIAKCGHVGTGRYIDKRFIRKASNKKEAVEKVLQAPRVKKHLKNAITSIREITKEEATYIYINIINKDTYLHATNSRQVLAEDVSNVKRLSPPKRLKRSFRSRAERIHYILLKEELNYGRNSEYEEIYYQ